MNGSSICYLCKNAENCKAYKNNPIANVVTCGRYEMSDIAKAIKEITEREDKE